MQVIDSHVHFWDPNKLHYSWLGEVPSIGDAHYPSDFRAASEGVNVTGMVFVEADCAADQSVEEADWITELAQEEPRLRGLVAAAALERGSAARPQLEALKERPLVKGVRRLIQAEGPGFAVAEDFIAGIRLLPEFGFSFDLCIKHPQFPEILELVEACPETTFILDHLGKPGVAAGDLDPWRAHVDALAAQPNVAACKVSGLITEADHGTWTEEELTPYLTHVFEAFGPDRLMFGGDWPVSVLAGGYQRWWEVISKQAAPLGEAACAKLFHDTAARVYRL